MMSRRSISSINNNGLVNQVQKKLKGKLQLRKLPNNASGVTHVANSEMTRVPPSPFKIGDN